MTSRGSRLLTLLKEMVTLSSARGQLCTIGFLTLAVYFSKYHWLDHLSLWAALGLDWAPSIGLTRAYWLLLHGQPVAAWHRNKLIYAVLIATIPLVISDIYKVVKRPAIL